MSIELDKRSIFRQFNELFLSYNHLAATKKSEPVVAAPSPSPPVDETSTTANNNSTRSSRSIRNIPKKQQRISEVYVKPEEPTSSVKNEQTDKAEHDGPETKTKSDDEEMEVAQRKERVNNRQQRRSQQVKHTAESTVHDDECMQQQQPESTTTSSDLHLLASANELLNETEVPKVDNDDAPRQSESTFHTSKSNDIEKRNLPPKERNKRAFRESPANNGTTAAAAAAPVDESSSHISEMKLPHKKKQSSRLISNDSKSTAVTESTTTTTPRRKRKSEVDIVSQSVPEDVEMVVESSESPLREEESASRRGQKRRITDDAEQQQQPPNSDEPSAKRIHADVDEAEPAADNGDAAAIESPSKLLNKIPKNALKLPAERVVELKKQGLVTVGADKMNKLTEMGKQIYKEIELREKEKNEKTVEDVAVEIVTATEAVAAPNNSQEVVDEVAKEAEESTVKTNNDSQNVSFSHFYFSLLYNDDIVPLFLIAPDFNEFNRFDTLR